MEDHVEIIKLYIKNVQYIKYVFLLLININLILSYI